MPPKFTPEPPRAGQQTSHHLENNAKIADYYDYLKSIAQGEGLGSITESDLDIFYHLLKFPQNYSKDELSRLFGLLQHLASGERFQDVKVARECLAMIETYRTELDL